MFPPLEVAGKAVKVATSEAGKAVKVATLGFSKAISSFHLLEFAAGQQPGWPWCLVAEVSMAEGVATLLVLAESAGTLFLCLLQPNGQEALENNTPYAGAWCPF